MANWKLAAVWKNTWPINLAEAIEDNRPHHFSRTAL
jgi:hypothetical protein